MADWIDKFLEYTDGLPTPENFRLWAGIAAVAGALERRVWVETARSALFPNLYTMLVGAPGVGKDQAIVPVRELWQDTRNLYLAPVNMSKAGLIDSLRDADRKLQLPNQIVEYHSLLVAVSELGVLVPGHDLEFLSNLNHIYDNPKNYIERKRGIGKPIQVNHPQINLLVGTQPGYLAELLPESAWSMGFTSRIIMIYAASGPAPNLFGKGEDRSELRAALVRKLRDFGKLLGKFEWEPEARSAAETWLADGCAPVPEHSKLQHYAPRRILHVLKLSMVAAISRTGNLLIEHEDFARARDWLLGAEQLMPDIFREMLQKSDRIIIDELHFFVWTQQARTKSPVGKAAIWNFLQQRVPSEKIWKIIDTAEKSNILARLAGTESYIARPKHEHGIE